MISISSFPAPRNFYLHLGHLVFVSTAIPWSFTTNVSIHRICIMYIHWTDSSSVAKKLHRIVFLALFIYKIITLPMGEQMQSLKPSCVLLSFLNERRKMIENARKSKWSPFFGHPWKWDGKHGFNNQLLQYLLIFQAADFPPWQQWKMSMCVCLSLH